MCVERSPTCLCLFDFYPPPIINHALTTKHPLTNTCTHPHTQTHIHTKTSSQAYHTFTLGFFFITYSRTHSHKTGRQAGRQASTHMSKQAWPTHTLTHLSYTAECQWVARIGLWRWMNDVSNTARACISMPSFVTPFKLTLIQAVNTQTAAQAPSLSLHPIRPLQVSQHIRGNMVTIWK